MPLPPEPPAPVSAPRSGPSPRPAAAPSSVPPGAPAAAASERFWHSDHEASDAAVIAHPLKVLPLPGTGNSGDAPVPNPEPTGGGEHGEVQVDPTPGHQKPPTGLTYSRAAHNPDSKECRGSTTELAPTPSPSLPSNQGKGAGMLGSAPGSPALSRTLQVGALLVAATLLVLLLEPLQLTADSISHPPALAHIRANAPHTAGLQSMLPGKQGPGPGPSKGGSRGNSGATVTAAAREMEAARAKAIGKGAWPKGRPRKKGQPMEGVTQSRLAPFYLETKASPRYSTQRTGRAVQPKWHLDTIQTGAQGGARVGARAGAGTQADASAAVAPTMPPLSSMWAAASDDATDGAPSNMQYDPRPEEALELEDLALGPAMRTVPNERHPPPRKAPKRIPMRPPRPWNVSKREWDERKWEEPVPVQNISELLQRADWYERRYFWAERGGNPKAPPLKGLALQGSSGGPGKGRRGTGKGGRGSGRDLVGDVFGGGRKYYWVIGGGDKCAGESHFSWSFTCVAAEARMLNRTFVLDLELCLHPVHNFGRMVINPLQAYYNVEHMVTRQPMIALPLFTLALDQQLRTPGAPNVSLKAYGWTQKVEQVQSEEATILVRDVGLNGYAYRICDYRGHVIHRDWRLLGHANPLWSIVNSITGSMGWDFDAVHIRRGDKLDPSRWPHLDFDTQPAQLLKKLPNFIRPGRRVYVSTNERTPGFFAPLGSKYRVHMLGQYKHLWSNRSEWYKWSRSLLKESHGFDVRMQAIVDYRVFRSARTKVETFNDLTDDPKHGI